MKALFIQLSDIHIKNVKNSIFDKKAKLLEAIQNETKSVDEVFLLITGDTVFSGSVEEFEISKTLFDEMIEYLSKYSGKKINTIILPGNHDCQKLTEENKAREGLIKFAQDNGSEAIDKNVVEILSSVQNNYFDFAKHYNPEPLYSNELLNIYKFQFGDKSLVFYTYNTAFQSVLHEQPGKMIYPVSMFDDNLFKEKANAIISCFHHPLHWLKPENRREFKFHVEKTSDFYFTGHEHEHTKSLISNLCLVLKKVYSLLINPDTNLHFNFNPKNRLHLLN
ncbi:MAG: metallophosphoesterase, partial [Bacteroidetes bacterium]